MDASFSSFLRAEEKDRLGSGGEPPAGVNVIVQGSALLRDLGGKPPAGVDVIVQGNALLKGVWGYPPDGMQGNALQKETILF